MAMMATQFQGIVRPAFDLLAEETLHTILFFLLARQELIHIGVIPVEPSFSKCSALLRVSRRFHRIGEHIVYRFNAFEVWSSDIWLYDFLTTLSVSGRKMITRLRIQWPDPSCPGSLQETLELINSCEGLTQVHFFHFPEQVAFSDVRKLALLPVDQIWFERSSWHPGGLTSVQLDGPDLREQMVLSHAQLEV